ncbi:MAPEG family protein [Candidatus Halocynthiibacter alkanivorans]|uniref:MAPEG family protein n=1 Tax=Candidatus Halocynthiibacter alkanivorans TaxID=2267619 RepID=UPI000DF3D5A2|nr:MAPEG family protein [Candidatus Halocynthiibacter alkanivorans]
MQLTTPLYAGILALIFIALSMRVVNSRHREKVSLGDGDNHMLNRQIRVHGNFAEYTPMTLLLILMAELQGLPLFLVHMLGIALVAGRVIHALSIAGERTSFGQRKTGMLLTFFAVAAAGVANIGLALF